MVLKEFQDPLLLPCDSRIEQKWLNMQGIWPNWLPTVGHTLAMTHVYNLKYTSLRLGMVFLCVHSPLPDPWLSWALIEPVVCTKILSSCSYPPGQWCNCEHWKMAFLFSFSLTGLSLLMPQEEQVQRCHHVSYTNKSNAILVIAWRVGKAVYCCAGAVQSVVQVLCMCGGAPYILQAWTCMGLAGALGMHQARPCYWSQTASTITTGLMVNISHG